MPRELTVSFLNGRLMAAYLYLDKSLSATAVSTEEYADGMLVDFDAAGKALGIEFIAPSKITIPGINSVLMTLGEAATTQEEVWPLIRRDSGVTAA